MVLVVALSRWLVDLNVADHLTYLGFDFTANYLLCKF
jgi:hypothetical protein